MMVLDGKSSYNIDYFYSSYLLDFIKNKEDVVRIGSIDLYEICVDIHLFEKDKKLITRVLGLYDAINFRWYSDRSKFCEWELLLDDVPCTVDDEIIFLKKFLSFAESITDKKKAYKFRSEEVVNKYNLK